MFSEAFTHLIDAVRGRHEKKNFFKFALDDSVRVRGVEETEHYTVVKRYRRIALGTEWVNMYKIRPRSPGATRDVHEALLYHS
ncbi:MAG: hypothetical protein V4437_01000 [Patescibacteria group bacterium]